MKEEGKFNAGCYICVGLMWNEKKIEKGGDMMFDVMKR